MDWRLTLLSVGILPLFAFIGAQVGEYRARSPRQGPEAAGRPERDDAGNALGFRRPADQNQRAPRLALEKFAGENEALTETQTSRP